MILDGKALAEKIENKTAERIQQNNKKPCLAVIQVGDNPASNSYVRSKEKACERCGIASSIHKLPEDTTSQDLRALISQLNVDKNINGILVQLPLPKHIDEREIIETILPTKDVDGFHSLNVGRLTSGLAATAPCTPLGIMRLLKEVYKDDLSGLLAVVIGRSNIVGKPVANLLLKNNATVVVCHSHTSNLSELTKLADIIIVATGKPNTLTGDMIKEGATVIDVGINRIPDNTKKSGYRLIGDCDFDSLKDKVSAITPVPGGVGPMTVAMLMANTYQCFLQQNS